MLAVCIESVLTSINFQAPNQAIPFPSSHSILLLSLHFTLATSKFLQADTQSPSLWIPKPSQSATVSLSGKGFMIYFTVAGIKRIYIYTELVCRKSVICNIAVSVNSKPSLFYSQIDDTYFDGIKVRIYRYPTKDTKRGLVFFHGGAWAFGSLRIFYFYIFKFDAGWNNFCQMINIKSCI